MAREPAAALTLRSRLTEAPAASDALAVFSVLWALAALLHVLGPSGAIAGVLSEPTAVGISQLGVSIAALLVLLAPRSTPNLVLLAVLGPISAWFEAPILGNHWLLAAFVDLGILAAVVSARHRRVHRDRGFERERVAAAALPIARWSLVGFYSFAAFSKLNSGFFDTTVGCGTFYFDELARSLGLSTPIAVGQGGWARLVPFLVAGTELAIPVLLLVRRTRNIGVLVGLVFHSVIALDQIHLFSDFSSVLVALFWLFLPPAFSTELIGRLKALPAPAGLVLRGTASGAVAALLVSVWTNRAQRFSLDGRMWLWLVLDAAVLWLVVAFFRSHGRERLEHPLSLGEVPRWSLLIPLLVILNGLTPYVELKTAYSWNMYANLRTAGGESNHLLIRRTFALNPAASEPVRILGTNDPVLGMYRDLGYDLPLLSLRAYLSENPSVSLRYLRGGVERDLTRASDEPELVRPISSAERRLFALRAVDQQDPPRCQETFLPAL